MEHNLIKLKKKQLKDSFTNFGENKRYIHRNLHIHLTRTLDRYVSFLKTTFLKTLSFLLFSKGYLAFLWHNTLIFNF